jgi:hypothetical protein
MQKTSFTVVNFVIVLSLAFFSCLSIAAGKTYSEDEFLNAFSGKSKKVVEAKLGKPTKKQQAVKPTNAGAVIGKNVEDKSQKPVKVEMWYYKNIVKYDPKRTYKETEITFVNDRVMNIGFFNNR